MQHEQYIYIDKYGSKRYYKDRAMTKLHRLDGPAFEDADGGKVWYVNGQLHGLDGRPAIEYANGRKEWWIDGQHHRLDGPAIEYADGHKAWYVDGKHITEKQFNALTAPTMELTLEEIASKFGVDASKIKIKK
jgi:hypothetical protein